MGCFADVFALEDDKARSQALKAVGRPTDLSSRAIEQHGAAWAKLQETLAKRLRGKSLGPEARQVVQEWADEIASSDALAGGIYEATLQADLAGQLFVRTVEVPELSMPAVRANAGARGPRRPRAFSELEASEAWEYFMERRIMTPEEFEALSDEHRQQAFTATQLASETLRQRAFNLIATAIAQGTSVQDFVRQMQEEEISLGLDPSSSGYLKTVFLTNVASAYGAGRFRQITSEVVQAARPYIEFRATLDDRTTDICRDLHGTFFEQSDPGWRRFAPPLHFNCRSVVLARKEATGRVVKSEDITVEPQRGFNAPPTGSRR